MSLKQAAKERLLWAIKQVVVPFGRIIMLVDPKSLKVVSSCCSVSELMDEGVDLVELLTKKREPLKGKYVLCMLSDDYSYLDLLFKDFVRGKEHYMGVFIMFNCHLKDDSVLRKIANQMDFDKVLGCFELHMNFVSFESRVFFTQNYYLKELYNMLASKSSYTHSDNTNFLNNFGKPTSNLQEYVDRVASRLASVCSVLNVHPKVSFFKNKYALTGMVASSVEQLLSRTLDKNASSNGELIIFDRSVDFSPLFIHEYTYQAFVYDLVQIDYCSYQHDPIQTQMQRSSSGFKRSASMEDKFDNCFKYKLITASNRDEVKEALLDPELDSLYNEYRHLHIQQVNARVSQEISKISDDASHQGKHDSNMQNTLELVRKLPNYQYTFDKCWAHLRLSERCFKYVESRQLVKIGAVEQMIATNMDSSGKHASHSKCVERLQEVLSENLDENDKLRLILLYLSNYTNLTRAHLSRLTCKLSPRALTLLNNILSSLPITNLAAGEIANGGDNAFFAPDQSQADGKAKDDKNKDGKVAHRLEKGELYNYYKKMHSEYELSRYLSEIVFVILQYVNHHYSHPLIQSTSSHHSTAEKKHKKHDNLESFNLLFKSSHEEKKKVIVYVLGGISLSECREIYRLCERKNVDVYLGGDEILIPSKVLEEFGF